MKIPPPLKQGDKIGVVAPSRMIRPEEMADALKDLRAWGFEPVLGKSLYAVDRQFAGTDAARAADFQAMLDDPGIRAVFCARGGYGALRIVDAIEFKALKRDPKWIIGFSDATTFTMAAYNAGVASIHGPMGISWNGATGDAQSRQYLGDVLLGKRPVFSAAPESPELSRPGLAKGRIIGGNLSMLSQLIGTPTDFDTKGCILFLEDLDEYLYHIDRMIVHLKRSGKFDRLAGLVIGGFTDMHDNSAPFGKTAHEIIAEAAAGHDYPICFGFPVGHSPRNFPILHGAEASLRVSHNLIELEFHD